MKEDPKNVLILTPFFSPNIGGVETHLDDLITALDKRGYGVHVVTYSPLTTPDVSWPSKERRGKNVYIRRYRWFGKNIFHFVEKYPLLDFLYLTPYLGMVSIYYLLKNFNKIDVIHAQGFNAALIGVLLKRLFRKKLVVSTHAVYETPPHSRTALLIKHILQRADRVLCLSSASKRELISFGVEPQIIDLYRYWVDLELFKPEDGKIDENSSVKNFPFIVLFVGRLIEKKGIKVLVKVAERIPDAHFVFVGVGPEENYLQSIAEEFANVEFEGKIENKLLPQYYSRSDIFCIPSQYEEGFGRVVMEAIGCGLPVIGSNRGGIPEALGQEVSILVEPTEKNLESEIRSLMTNRKALEFYKNNCRDYASANFSEKNVEMITRHYTI